MYGFNEAYALLRSANKETNRLTLKNIVKASIYLSEVQKLNNCIPEFAINKVAKDFVLTNEEARKIRDIIQNNS